MIFEERITYLEKNARKTGYLFSYFLMTTLLFFILKFSKRLPDEWNYLNIMVIVAFVAVIGTLIKRGLK
jgi:hypothetical protein